MPTGIEWADETWNPVTGCTRVSEGCANCYAARMAKRLQGRFGYPESPHEFEVTLHEDRLDQPLHWTKARRVFVVSMGDLFHEDVPDQWIEKIFQVMTYCPQHTFQVLTKRPARMKEYLGRYQPVDILGDGSWIGLGLDGNRIWAIPETRWPLPNVWLGITAENEARFYERYPYLAQVEAAVRFVSMEPLLGPIRMGGATPDWVIVGGETGPGARRMDPAWAVDIKEQCQAAGVPFFYKGAGTAALPRSSPYYRVLDGRTWEEFPVGNLEVGSRE